VGTKYGAMAEAMESLIAQLHSQGKLTMPRHEIEILKANEHTLYV
jgi:hypothetical protein